MFSTESGSKLSIRSAERTDSGLYKVTAKNDIGEDAATSAVIVLGIFLRFRTRGWGAACFNFISILFGNSHLFRWLSNFSLSPAGKPGSPEGPLKVSDITESHVTLTWREPKDDGGSRVTHYQVEMMDTSKGLASDNFHIPKSVLYFFQKLVVFCIKIL